MTAPTPTKIRFETSSHHKCQIHKVDVLWKTRKGIVQKWTNTNNKINILPVDILPVDSNYGEKRSLPLRYDHDPQRASTDTLHAFRWPSIWTLERSAPSYISLEVKHDIHEHNGHAKLDWNSSTPGLELDVIVNWPTRRSEISTMQEMNSSIWDLWHQMPAIRVTKHADVQSSQFQQEYL